MLISYRRVMHQVARSSSIAFGMIQQFGQNRPDVHSLSRRLTYQAILEPKP